MLQRHTAESQGQIRSTNWTCSVDKSHISRSDQNRFQSNIKIGCNLEINLICVRFILVLCLNIFNCSSKLIFISKTKKSYILKITKKSEKTSKRKYKIQLCISILISSQFGSLQWYQSDFLPACRNQAQFIQSLFRS